MKRLLHRRLRQLRKLLPGLHHHIGLDLLCLHGSRCLTEQSGRGNCSILLSASMSSMRRTPRCISVCAATQPVIGLLTPRPLVGRRTYTVPKLFLELLPDDFDMVVTLDNDVVALADLAHLADEIERLSRSLPHAALFYASEQQNNALDTQLDSSLWPWPTHRNGINGGVGVQLLDRLRSNADAYRTMMQKVLDELDDVVIGGRLERTALNGLGDQTAFSAAAVVAPATWAAVSPPAMRMELADLCVVVRKVNECPLHEGRLNTTALTVAGYELLKTAASSLYYTMALAIEGPNFCILTAPVTSRGSSCPLLCEATRPMACHIPSSQRV